jgi:hypothetical protein
MPQHSSIAGLFSLIIYIYVNAPDSSIDITLVGGKVLSFLNFLSDLDCFFVFVLPRALFIKTQFLDRVRDDVYGQKERKTSLARS